MRFLPGLRRFVVLAVWTASQSPALGADTPPPGTRSLFDFAFTKAVDGKLVYDVPNSFPAVLQRLQDLTGSAPTAVAIPLGRSVQRFDTDLTDPRVVATINADLDRPASAALKIRLTNRIFVGFGQKADQLEVISYNERAARFEFQLVRNLTGRAGPQQVMYAPRNFCNKCHYHEVPMFPRNPWQETAAFPATANAVLDARRTAGDTSGTYLGVPIAADNSVAYAFDRATDQGAFVVAYQRMWQQGCGALAATAAADAADDPDGPNCRALLLKVGMRTMFKFFSVPVATPEYTALSQLFFKNAKAAFGDQFFFPISDLRARNPLDVAGGFVASGSGPSQFLSTDSNTLERLKQGGSIPKEFDPLNSDVPREDPYMFAPGRAPAASVYQYPDYLALDDIPKIRRTDDPTTLNEFLGWLARELRVDKNFWRQFYQTTGQTPFVVLDQIIDALPPQLLGVQPFFEDDLVVAAARLRNLPVPVGHYDGAQLPDAHSDQSDLATKPEDGLTDVQVAASSDFNLYCSDCHNPGAGDLGFVTGHFADLKARGQKILQRLDWERCKPPQARQNMPPRGHRRQICAADDASRQRMLSVIADAIGVTLDGSDTCGGPDTTLPQPNPQARAQVCK